jgi:site-specific recombinase XerD
MEKSQKPIIQFLNDFLDWLEVEKGLSSKTQENYARFLKRFFDWLKIKKLQNLKPDELSPKHIQDYRLFLARRFNLKKSTQIYYLIALRSLLTFFAKHDILSLPPEKVNLPKRVSEREIRFLTLKDLEKLFSQPDTSKIQGIRDRAIMEVLFSTGMRISELCSLNKDQIKIPQKIEEIEISIIGKGGKVRPVYLSKRAVFWLKKYLEQRTDNRKALFISHKRKTSEDLRLTPRFIQKMIKKYALLAGLPPNTTPHVLRHSFATDLLARGVDLKTIQEFLGHKTITATQIYTHVTSHRLKEVHKKFHGGKYLKI